MSLLKLSLIFSFIYSILAQPVCFHDSGESAKSLSAFQVQARLRWLWEEAPASLLLCGGPGSGPSRSWPFCPLASPCKFRLYCSLQANLRPPVHILKPKLDLPKSPCTRIRELKPQKDSNLEYSVLIQTPQHHKHEKKQKHPLVLKSSLFSHHPTWQGVRLSG